MNELDTAFRTFDAAIERVQFARKCFTGEVENDPSLNLDLLGTDAQMLADALRRAAQEADSLAAALLKI